MKDEDKRERNSEKWICSNCGYENYDEDTNCSRCGEAKTEPDGEQNEVDYQSTNTDNSDVDNGDYGGADESDFGGDPLWDDDQGLM